jgi:hypothetical protein
MVAEVLQGVNICKQSRLTQVIRSRELDIIPRPESTADGQLRKGLTRCQRGFLILSGISTRLAQLFASSLGEGQEVTYRVLKRISLSTLNEAWLFGEV